MRAFSIGGVIDELVAGKLLTLQLTCVEHVVDVTLLSPMLCETATRDVVALRLCCSKSFICDSLEELAKGVERLINLALGSFSNDVVPLTIQEGAVVVSKFVKLLTL